MPSVSGDGLVSQIKSLLCTFDVYVIYSLACTALYGGEGLGWQYNTVIVLQSNFLFSGIMEYDMDQST